MPLTLSLLETLEKTYPLVMFRAGDRFVWSPEAKSVFYAKNEKDADALLLHELSHALLAHRTYSRDVELIAMEAAAWDKARELAKKYDVEIQEAAVDAHLDTYREWLHSRSTCPACDATGFQDGKNTYTCPACTHQWRVNEARLCELRRYSIK